MAKLKALTCPVCSAPLEVPVGAATVACRYCGTSMQVQQGRPPAVPPPTHQAPVVYVQGGGAARAALVATLVPLTIALATGGYAVLRAHGGAASLGPGSVTLPARCAVNGEVTLKGQTFTGPGVLIEGAANCTVRIVDSTLTGDVIVKGGTNVHVIVEKSTLHAHETGVDLDLNGDVKLVDATIDGAEVAVRGGVNLKVDATRADIAAKSHAVVGSTNLKAVLRQCTVKSEEEAIRGEQNVEVTLEGGTLRGGDAAVRGEHNTKVRASKKARLEGRAAVKARANPELTLEDATAFGDDVGLEAESNAKVRLSKGALLRGGRAGLAVGSNLDLEVAAATIESPGSAVVGGSNARVELRTGAAVKGGARAFAFSGKPTALALGDAQITGAQVFDTRESPTPTPTPMTTPTPARPGVKPRAAAPGDPLAPPVAPKVTKAPPFQTDVAQRLLTDAKNQAQAACRSSNGKPVMVFVNPRFTVDGVNRAELSDAKRWTGTPEGACVLLFFQRVKVPPFDWDTRVSGMGQAVNLK